MAITSVGLGGPQVAYGPFVAKSAEAAPQAAYVSVFHVVRGGSLYAVVVRGGSLYAVAV